MSALELVSLLAQFLVALCTQQRGQEFFALHVSRHDGRPPLCPQVLKLPSVGSKRFLTNKVDRSVSGLVAQQQYALHLTLHRARASLHKR
jgi:hypothetical protein